MRYRRSRIHGLPFWFVPGAFGTQRLPRLIGMEAAIDIASTSRPVSAQTLLKLGGLDLIAEGDLKTAAREFITHLPMQPLAVSQLTVAEFDISLIAKKRREIIARSKGQVSPIHNIDAMEWATLPYSRGQPLERSLHMKLRATAESRALRYALLLNARQVSPIQLLGYNRAQLTRWQSLGGGYCNRSAECWPVCDVDRKGCQNLRCRI